MRPKFRRLAMNCEPGPGREDLKSVATSPLGGGPSRSQLGGDSCPTRGGHFSPRFTGTSEAVLGSFPCPAFPSAGPDIGQTLSAETAFG